ncbi:hypothetical protein FHU41_001967 [Psychromicrobium silvestre]|uniref:Uncharacterized protein n=1 Tax=Psychromicrobium silvestre TaxID=1645614 RepID=A0A7Y9LUA5_9MICC|nr:hypothetical protein [Psychromicrobium silvestre]NYE95717.1 hypothetical protein [Psychromicrobium silvestre]
MTEAKPAEAPSSSRLVRIAAGWLFGLLLAIAAAIITIQLVNANLYGPQQPVRDYFQALRDGDGERALGLLQAELPNAAPDLLDGDALKKSAEGISDVHIGNPATLSGGRVKITVSYQLGGQTQSTDFTLQPAGTQWMFFNKWAFVPSSLPTIEVSVVNEDQAMVNGVAVNMPAGKNTFSVLYPGSYQAEYQDKLFTAKAVSVTVASPSTQSMPMALATEPSTELLQQVDTSLKNYLDQCATQKVLLPSGCPLSHHSLQQVDGSINWKIVEYPKAAISAYNGGWVISPLTVKARIQYKEQDLGTGAFSNIDEEQDYGFTAKLSVNGNAITVTPVVEY